MSVKKWRFRVEHILESIERIWSYTEGLTYEEFSQDSRTIDAVIRNLALLGEAARHIPFEIQEKYRDTPWSAMKAMRNVLIHEYERIDQKIVWRTIWDDLPLLPPLLKNILDKEKDE